MIEQREDRPAYVRFERVAKEDVVASKKAGRYIARDEDMAFITPPYSKDVFKIKVDQWFRNLAQDEQNGRIPHEWVERYKESYELWQRGQEMPLSGTPIKGWGVISPAQQETMIRMNILTVEDLAGINDEGIKRLGMGAVDLRNKAQAWISQLNDKGAATQEIAALKKENDALRSDVRGLTAKLEELISQVNEQNKESVSVTVEGITADELLETDERNDLREEYIKLYGKPPHHLMKTDTIRRRIEAKQ